MKYNSIFILLSKKTQIQRNAFLVLFLLVSLVVSAQCHYQGRVVSAKGEAIPFANVILQNESDSSFVMGTTTNEEGIYEMKAPKSGNLKISCIGYASKIVQNPKETENIILSSDAVELKEVTVKATTPVTRIDGEALSTNIKGTILQNIGTAKDVLGQLPGVINNQGNIEVFGKGTPIFYINGRLLRNNNELERLKSDKIIKVEVITNPGSKYDATVNSVVKIYVEKNAGEGLSLDNTLLAGYSDYLYGKEQIDLDYQTKKLSVFASLEYDRSKNKCESENVQESWLANVYKQNILMSAKTRKQMFDGQVGFAYTISPFQSFGVYYDITHAPTKKFSTMSTQSWLDEALESNGDVDFHSKNKETQHLVDGYYSGVFGKWTLDVTMDAFWKTTDTDEASREAINQVDNRTITSNDDAEARMLAGEIHLSRMLGKGKLSFGSECSYSRREDDFLNKEEVLEDNNALVKETNAALYAELMQRVGCLTFQLGVRYEHVNSGYYEYGKKIDEQSRVYDKFFPTAMLVFPISKVGMVQVSYSKKYNRPLYSQLSSTISYVNRYLYQSGNPMLKPSYTDNFAINVKYRWLMLMANYSHVKDKIISSFEHYNGDNNITLIKKSNSPYSLDNLQVMVSAMPRFGKYNPMLACGLIAQFYEIDFLGEKKKMNNPMPVVRFNNLLQLTSTSMLNADFTWKGKGHSENIYINHETWSLNFGFTKMFNKHWNLKLAVNDLFNGTKTNKYIIYDGVSQMGMVKHINTRNVECTLRYTFNKSKSKYRGKGAGNDEMKRL